jgi:multicomponent Na+:H+ antiporter subunit D
MTEHFPIIVVLAPFFGALLCGLCGPRFPRLCPAITLASMGLATVAAMGLLGQVAAGGTASYFVGGWARPLGIGIELRVDGISALVLVAVAVAGLLVAVFTAGRLGWEAAAKAPQHHALLLLLMVGLLGITATGDAFNLYVMIEVGSLAGYALLGMGPEPRGRLATYNYLLMGTIGASFYLLGVGYLYLHTGELNMQRIQELLAGNPGAPVALVALVLVMLGLWVKMALVPLGGWLPNVYTYAPPLAALVTAPLVTKVMVYVMVRMILSVFGWHWVFDGAAWNQAVVWLAVAAILTGAVMALAQREFKRMLCCLILAEVGYMVGGVWLANRWGMTGAVYHLLGDVFMTLTLFLAAGVLAGKSTLLPLTRFAGMFRRRPWVMAAVVVGALGMIGLPPTCGFFSKWFLLRGGLETGQYGFVAALLLSSLVNAVLFFRIFEIAVFGNHPAAHGHGAAEGADEVDDAAEAGGCVRWTDYAALYGAAAMVLVVGLGSGWISGVIQGALDVNQVPPASPAVTRPAHSESPTPPP